MVSLVRTQDIDGTLIQTAEMTKMKWNGKRNYIILIKIALYFSLQVPQGLSGKEYVERKPLQTTSTMIGRR